MGSGAALPNLELTSILLHFFVLITAIPLHEFAHAWVADRLGDDTPRRNGRVTLNPLAHLHLYGSIALLVFGFGWGNPVPVNAANFKKPKRDMALCSLAGPLANVFIALVLLILSKPLLAYMPQARYYPTGATVVVLLETVLSVNLYLAVFNLVPVPPLDGSNILGAFLPDRAVRFFSDHAYKFMIVLAILLMTGLLQIPIHFLAGQIFRALQWLTSPLNALFV